MNAPELVARLIRLGVALRVEGAQLAVRAARGVLTAPLREQLTRHKQEILELLAGLEQARPGAPRSGPAPCEGVGPLSPAQQRLWFIHQVDPAGFAYNVAITIRLRGPLSIAALERSLSEIARRHEALRTTFAVISGEPVQKISPPRPVELSLVDLRTSPEAEAERIATEQAESPFDLGQGPLFRARLLRLGAEEHRLLLTVHHIVFDAWSTSVLLRELEALLPAFTRGDRSPLPPLSMQVIDAAQRQRQRLSGGELEAQLAYWREQLRDAPPALTLPTDRPRPAAPSGRGGQVARPLPAPLVTALSELAREESATLFMLLLSSLTLLLSRLSGQRDLVVGAPAAGRDRSGAEALVGFFVNTLALRADLSGEPTFRAHLARTAAAVLRAYENADAPFERVVAEVQPERRLGHTPLFQVMFNLVNLADERLSIPGLDARVTQTMPGSRFDLTVYAHQRDQRLDLVLAYSADLFDRPRAEAMLDQLASLLAQIAEDPGRPIGDYGLLAPRGVDTAAPLDEPRYEPVTELVARCAARAPGAIAVRRGELSHPYAELLGRARALAGALLRRGLDRGGVVAVTGPRSFGLIAAMLGAMLGGARLLTLDQALPVARRRIMLEAARAAHALCVGGVGPDDGWMLEVPGLELMPVRPEDGTAEAAAGAGDEVSAGDAGPTLPEIRPDDAAYLFFTSGSTGTPKGVIGCHRGLSHFLVWQRDTFGVGPGDRVAQLTALSFDVVLRDVFLPLISGATLVLPEEERPDPDRLLRWLDREAITILHAVPTLATSWLTAAPLGASLRALRWIFFAGEPLPSALVERWRSAFPGDFQIGNLYGPTETTLAKCFYRVPDPPLPGVQPVGAPLPSTQALVLNERGLLCGVGEPGEIVLRTPFRSLGYLDAPEEQAARFVVNPFRDDPRDLLYRTGDRGRYRPDGALEILGRLDHQVKIRGVRVELGEIEASLRRHPGVREAVVAALDDARDGVRLVAHLVCAEGAALAPGEVRSFLGQTLPDYMIPRDVILHEALPRTASGKVDRRALPPPGARAPGAAGRVAPRGPVEEAIAGVFADALRLPWVGAHDGFFTLGGHSLLATQVISRVRRLFGVDLPLRCLFEAGTPAALAELVTSAMHGGGEAAQPPAFEVEPAGDERELSFAEERLWVLERLEPGSAAYLVVAAERLTGALDVGALERALEALLHRHEALRTTYSERDGRPVARIQRDARLDWMIARPPGATPPERDEAARRAILAEVTRPFDLASGPLFRARLLALAEGQHLLLLVMHHLVSDGWTLGILRRELAALYAAAREGRPPLLPDRPLPYAAFVRWQRRWMQGATLERQLDYWRRQLEGAPTAIDLPFAGPRPAAPTRRGARRRAALPPALTRALLDLGRREGVTLFMTLLAALDALLFRYTGQRDLVVGTPIAGRNRAELEGLVGSLANTLALRVRLSPDLTFRELLGRVREVCFGAYAHQDLPFERLVKELEAERDLRRSPVFQVMLVLHNAPAEPLALPGVEVERVVADNGTAKLDLSLIAMEQGDGLDLVLEHSAELLDAASVERVEGHLRVLLEAAAANPEARVGDLPLLTPAERRQLVAWNATAARYPAGTLLHELFEAQAARTPDAPAVGCEGRSLTYRELDRRSSLLARQLTRMGVGPDVLAAVCVERSIEMVVALLGVLKAGGAYLPIDLSYPDERIAFMLEDARARVLLTLARSADRLAGRGAAVLAIDAEAASGFAPAGEPPARAATPDNLAYVIYTSGSTGRPRAAMIPHRAVVNHMRWMLGEWPLGPDDAVLQKTPFSFDASVWEIFAPLLSGARLVLARPDGHRDTAYLTEEISRERVTVLQVVPAALEPLLLEPGLDRCSTLRRLYCGGEPLSRALSRRAAARLRLDPINLYGPTEATIQATYHACGRDEDAGAIFEPVGRPIANATAYVLDPRLQPVPVGVHGELYLGGACVGRGYLRRPGATAERFIPDPFGLEPGARLYRTGDRACLLPSGDLVVLGRTDDQVKIRGHRIELGEIGAALAAHPGVIEAVAVAREDAPGERRLVAYAVPAGQEPPTADELRSFLRERLPEPLIPAAILLLDQLPRSPSGKLDRKALPAPAAAALPERARAAPRSAIERELARIWAATLRLPEVGVFDHFFEIGGDSILAIQIVARARQAGIRITPRQIFQRPTVAELAHVAETGAAPAEQGPITGAAPLTPIQRSWVDLDLDGRDHWNQALLLEVAEPMDPAALEAAVARLLEHHDALRARLARGERGWEQRFAEPGGPTPLRRIDLSGLSPAERRSELARAAQEEQEGLDLTAGPAVRVAWFDLGRGLPARLLIVIHHLAVDAVSWRVLLEDLWAAYQQRRRGEAIRLPEKTTSFKRWAERLLEHAQGEALAAERSYWQALARRRIGPLPVDHERGDNTEGEAATISASLSPEETGALLGRPEDPAPARAEDLLLTALAAAFAPWSGPTLQIDLEGHGREDVLDGVDVSRTVGWFTTLFPVILDLPAAAEPGEALASIQAQVRAIPGRGMGYGLLRYLREGDELSAELRAMAEAQVSFNYLGQLDAALPEGTPLRRAEEPPGCLRAPRARRRHLIDVDAAVLDGRLTARWTYAPGRHERGTIEALAGRFIASLRALLERRPAAGEPPIESVHVPSPMQEGMLFHSLYEPRPDVYLTQTAWTLEGELDEAALVRAFEGALERHPILRACLAWERLERPQLIIRGSPVRLPVERHDWRGLPREERASRLERFMAADRERGFELDRAPLCRLALLRLRDDAWRVVWTCHHILLDGWSKHIVLGEIFALYGERARGAPARLPARAHVGDHLAWLERQDLARVRAFWRERLRGFSAPTPLGVDRRPTAGEQPSFREIRRALPAAALSAFARQHGLTMSTLLLGAWALLLSRYSGEDDVVFGVTVSGRAAPLEGIEGMVGLLINTLPARVQVDPGRAAAAWLSELQAWQAELRDHEHSPLVEVQAASEIPRGTPLFESLLVFENYPRAPAPDLAALGLRISDVAATAHATYPLTVAAAHDGGLTLALEYDRRRFDDAAMERMLEHLTTLLEELARDPARSLDDIPMLTDEERRLLLVSWNDAAAPYPTGESLCELVEAQAARAPGAVAAVFQGRRLSYQDLDELANGLAVALAASGAGPGALVPVLMDRCLELVIAELAALKAGAAFVPLDPAWPPARLGEILDQLGGAPILADGAALDAARSLGRPTILVDLQGARSRQRPGARARGEDPIYVIYTSGTTGKPKGVVIPHRGVMNRLQWMTDFFGDACAEAVLQTTRPIYDSAVWQVFWPLLHGGKVVLPAPGEEASAERITELVASEGVTMTDFVPSVLSAILPRLLEDEDAGRKLRALRTIIVGGEELRASTVAELRACLERVRVVNLYGPTEASIGCIYHEVRGDEGERIPIGRPIANAYALILDRRRRLVPPGVTGELYLSGRCLGHGYLGDPEGTRAVFVDNPYAEIPCDRLYRTGDLARRLPDREIEFCGRADAQVKVRGVRIELAEIEAALSAHPAIRAAVATVFEDARGEKQLAAYFVPHPDAALSGDDLRRHLRARLPAAMVPSALVPLERLPLSPGGKVDRRALPAPAAAPPPDGARISPRGPVEQAVAGIFAEVLGIGAVGAHDDFFALGGHSLRATQAISRVRSAIGVDLPLRAVFEAPTAASLAARVEAQLQAGRGSEAPPLRRTPRDGGIPLSFAQERLWFLNQLDPDDPSYVLLRAIRIEGALDAGALARALRAVVLRHEALRTTFAMVDGSPTQVIHEDLDLPLPVEELDAPSPEERDEAVRLRAAAARRPFDLSAGPLSRVALLRLSPEEHVLLWATHHIASDAWTAGILDDELAALYEAQRGGRPAQLPELPIQYADYARWQRAWISGELLDRQLRYWLDHLAGAPAALELPADRPRPPVRSHRGARRAYAIPPPLASALSSLGRREGATLFMTLLAAFKALLFRYTAQQDIVVGTPIANRTRPETERLAGFFVNTLALRSRLSGGMTFAELLRAVREVCLGAYANQDLPFERLVQALDPERDQSRSPVFQVMFVLQNAPRGALGLPGLTLTELDTPLTSSQFDLTLCVAERPGGLAFSVEYSTDLFEAATIDRMAGHLEALLAGAARAPGTRLRDLPLLTEGERLLLQRWNDTAAPCPEEVRIHALFEAQASRTPDATALVFEDRQLTYRALNERADRLARRLRGMGVGPDVPVGLHVQRSIEMLVGLFGLLKAGGAYLPLDPGSPPERLSLMLQETRTPVILTQARHAGGLPDHGARIVLLDEDAETEPLEGGRDGDRAETLPDHLAYVIYTSGSTGRPKAAMISHRSLENHTRWLIEAFSIGASDVFLQKTPFTFDASVLELITPLLSGARLVIADPDAHRDPEAILQMTAAHGVTLLQLVPSMLQALVSLPGSERLRAVSLRHLFCGGEPLSLELAERFASLCDAELHNLYGATEVTDDVTCWTYRRGANGVPIGRPLPNVQAHVLDRNLEAVPVGVPGELHIGGAHVGRGYFDRRALTAERFIPDPFAASEGARMYRTGDLVRRLPSGEIEHLGRTDFQVKVRGHRIELGEIEAVLRRHHAVHEAVVVAQGDRGEERLIAFVIPAERCAPAASELERFLEQALPRTMVPSAFVLRDALPLTPHGKVDRRALRGLAPPAPDGRRPCAAPRDLLEAELVRIWESVLSVRPIGIHDNFFELGGHSLLAVRVIDRIHRLLGRRPPLSRLFQAPTIKHLAEAVREHQRDAPLLGRATLLPLQPSGEKRPFVCVAPLGARAAVHFTLLARHLSQDRPLVGLEPPLFSTSGPPPSLEEIVAECLRALREAYPQGPYLLGGYCSGGVLAFELAQQLIASGEDVAALILLNSHAPPDQPEPDGEPTDEAWIEGFAMYLTSLSGGEPPGLPIGSADLPPGDLELRLGRVLEQATASRLLGADTTLAELRDTFAYYQAHTRRKSEIVRRYRPSRHPGAATLFRTGRPSSGGDPTHGWSRLITGSIAVRVIQGNNATMLGAEHVAGLARLLDQSLDELPPATA